ncbi:radical SAM protein [Paenibacillus oralis]|uniref:Radical SAM protein n=1 Tax=Paenibacillus oralis TaxID=2490856 RepID=A0A3P3U1A2_9BACL|nr:radical SAM protein [Paenibacillus oralis]RRJ63389.1 radical SAM protein [Paenibacillus oralis]
MKPAIFIELTRRCTYSCYYCGAWRHEGSKRQELPAGWYGALFRVLADIQPSRVNFTGGEPTLREDICEIVGDAVSKVGDSIHLTTNGSLITKRLPLWELPISLIKVNINTIDSNLFRRITGTDYLSRVLEGIGYLQTKGAAIRLHSVVTQDTLPHAESLIQFCDRNLLQLKLFEIDTDLSSCNKQRVDIAPIKEYLDQTSPFKETLESPGMPILVYHRHEGNEIHLVGAGQQKYNRELCNECPKFPCHYGLYSLSIDPEGYAYPCLIEPERMRTRLPVEDFAKTKEILVSLSDLIDESVVIS